MGPFLFVADMRSWCIRAEKACVGEGRRLRASRRRGRNTAGRRALLLLLLVAVVVIALVCAVRVGVGVGGFIYLGSPCGGSTAGARMWWGLRRERSGLISSSWAPRGMPLDGQGKNTHTAYPQYHAMRQAGRRKHKQGTRPGRDPCPTCMPIACTLASRLPPWPTNSNCEDTRCEPLCLDAPRHPPTHPTPTHGLVGQKHVDDDQPPPRRAGCASCLFFFPAFHRLVRLLFRSHEGQQHTTAPGARHRRPQQQD